MISQTTAAAVLDVHNSAPVKLETYKTNQSYKAKARSTEFNLEKLQVKGENSESEFDRLLSFLGHMVTKILRLTREPTTTNILRNGIVKQPQFLTSCREENHAIN